MDCERRALQRNLPHELHALVQRHFEDAQRHRDHIGRVRERMLADNPSSAELPA